MTRVMFVGEMYYPDLSVGGGPIYPSGPAPRPPGPVDPGYSPPWARPPVDPGWGVIPPVDPGYGVRPPVDPGYGVRPPVDPAWGVRPPVDPGYSPPWARPMPPVISGGPGSLPPFAMPPIYIPGQSPITDPIDPTKAHAVLYVPVATGGYERITFTIDVPPPSEPPTEATPKV